MRRDLEAGEGRRNEVSGRVDEADTVLSASEKVFGELTGALADLTARRNALDGAAREQTERVSRLAGEVAEVEAELSRLEAQTKGKPDPKLLAAAIEAAQKAVMKGEADALRAETAHSAARQALDAVRGPLAEAERRSNRLETEAKTLRKVLHVEAGNLWPAVIDNVTVAKGYEIALGAALGDDLEAPVDPQAPMRWGGAAIDPSDPSLPEGAEPLEQICESAARAGAPPAPDRRGPSRQCAGIGRPAQAGAAAGVARGRSVALGRLRGGRQCADRSGAAACRSAIA